jgi:Ca2+-transporting ATPase
MVLIAAAALTIVTADYADAAVIALVVIVNTTLSVRQEVGADRALAALESLASPTSMVLRDGRQQVLPAAELVPGDVVLLAEGDLVPADGTLIESVALRVDESTMTGESIPVDKRPADPAEASASSRVLAGTAVVHGRARVLVQATGAESAVGQIAGLLGSGGGRTPLQRRMARLSGQLAATAVGLSAVVLLTGWAQGQDLELMLVAAASLVVAAVPESLPAVVTVSLALAARRMARRGAVVRNLGAVETLGSVTLLATDKTGTLTEASMSVVEWWSPAGVDRSALYQGVRLCNDAHVDADGLEVGTDPTEVALLRATRNSGLGAAPPRIAELPFDSDRKRMATVHLLADGDVLVVCKGAPESVLDDAVLADPPALVAEARQRGEELSGAGLRVLAVAEKRLPGHAATAPTSELTDGAEAQLHLLGLVGLQDPARKTAGATLLACREAGIRVALVTGDHAATASRVAEQVGVTSGPPRVLDLSARRTVTGPARIDELPGALEADVIARATPADKLLVVSGWQRDGHVVAMTGDGVNDGPALRRADIGVAMGRRGTEVARQSADLVLGDDNLGTLVVAVEEGRRVYANIRRFLLYGLSGGAAEILVMLVGPLVGQPLPLLPGQILWLNLLTHSVVGTALGSEPGEDTAMRRPPRNPAEGVLGGGLWWRVLALALIISAVAAPVATAAAPAATRSALLLGLGAPMLGVAIGVRARHARRGRARRSAPANPLLPAAVAVSAGLLLAAVTLRPLQELLSTTSPDVLVVALATAGAGVGFLAAKALRPG